MSNQCDNLQISDWLDITIKLNHQINDIKEVLNIKYPVYDANIKDLVSPDVFYWDDFHLNGDQFSKNVSSQYFVYGFVNSILVNHIEDNTLLFNLLFNPTILESYNVKITEVKDKYINAFFYYLKSNFPRVLVLGSLYTRLKIAMEKVIRSGSYHHFIHLDTFTSIFAQILTSLINFFTILWISDAFFRIKNTPKLFKLSKRLEKYNFLEIIYYPEDFKKYVDEIVECGIVKSNTIFKDYSDYFNIVAPTIN